MSALACVETLGSPVADPLVNRLDALLIELGAAVADCGAASDTSRIDRIGRLEKLRAVTAALQAAECVRFAQSQVAELVVTETRHLGAPARRTVDRAVVAAGICELGTKSAAACVRKHAYAADPQAYVARGRMERKNRRVGLRPAPDTMAILTGYLPVEQGVACYAALHQHTDATVATGDARTRDQIMADTLVERLTGQARATDVDVELQVMMPLEALTDPDSGRAATVAGYGS